MTDSVLYGKSIHSLRNMNEYNVDKDIKKAETILSSKKRIETILERLQGIRPKLTIRFETQQQFWWLFKRNYDILYREAVESGLEFIPPAFVPPVESEEDMEVSTEYRELTEELRQLATQINS